MNCTLGWGWRLALALVIAFLITAVMTGASLVLSSAFARSSTLSSELGAMAVVFGVIFIFWYFTFVREPAKRAEFERLSRLGAKLSRKR